MTTTLTNDELRDWNARLVAARGAQADSLKASASRWAGYIGTLVGAVGAISIIVAPKALAAFSDGNMRTITWISLSIAGIAGFSALVQAMRAAGKLGPRIDAGMDAVKYHDAVVKSEVNGVKWLGHSRKLTGVAIFGVLLGSVLSVVDTLTAPSSNVNVAVVNMDGTTWCGPIGSIAQMKTASSIIVVQHC